MAGNCLFTSCGYHLHIDAKILREQVAKFIFSNLDVEISGVPIRTWIEESGEDPQSYPSKISRNGVIGTAIELAIIALIYQRTICVHFKESGLSTEYFPQFGSPFQVVFMGPADNGHYEPN